MTAAAYWRNAGLTYARYVNLCAKALRLSIKPGPIRDAAMAREAKLITISTWKAGQQSVFKGVE